jgi:hypothetical protein
MPIHKLQQAVAFEMAPVVTLTEFKAEVDEIKASFCERHAIPLGGTTGKVVQRQSGGEEGGGGAPGAGSGEGDAVGETEEQDTEEDALVRSFWRLVKTGCESLVVPYGADLDTDTHGSGFSEGEAGEWNLQRLARARGSLLDESVRIDGVSSPWLYVGGIFAAFCWHTEDLWMYSCNHLHEGAPKSWYVVPGSSASRFEKATRSLLPPLFSDQPDLLYQLNAMVAPSDLRAQGVPVYRLTQRPGEFIVTLPRAYHAGIPHAAATTATRTRAHTHEDV